MSVGRRLLGVAYAQVQSRPQLKRVAVRLLMWFPGLGTRALAAVGSAPMARAPACGVPEDAAAREVYLRDGYRPLLTGAPAAAVPPRRQLLVDISGLIERDARTGIQRVVRNLTRALAQIELEGWRVEPIYQRDGRFHYARGYATCAWGVPCLGLGDDPVDAGPGDVFFTADLALLPIVGMHRPLRALRERGVAIHFVLHDLIPLFHPEFYQGEVDPRFSRWLDIVFDVADGVLCVSNAVATELRELLAREPQRVPRGMPRIGWFHLGADLDEHARATPGSSAGGSVRARCRLGAAPTFLMVGTLEPRKGHEQVLLAFERLWAEGLDVNLLIVGKTGWSVRALVERLRTHPEAGRRLCWIEGADDAMLREAYSLSSALIAASHAEGFGLPLIESAQHGLPIIARDLPVFREVAGEHAFYFQAAEPGELAAAVRDWLALDARGQAPASRDMPHLTWQQSARQVAAAILPPDGEA